MYVFQAPFVFLYTNERNLSSTSTTSFVSRFIPDDLAACGSKPSTLGHSSISTIHCAIKCNNCAGSLMKFGIIVAKFDVVTHFQSVRCFLAGSRFFLALFNGRNCLANRDGLLLKDAVCNDTPAGSLFFTSSHSVYSKHFS